MKLFKKVLILVNVGILLASIAIISLPSRIAHAASVSNQGVGMTVNLSGNVPSGVSVVASRKSTPADSGDQVTYHLSKQNSTTYTSGPIAPYLGAPGRNLLCGSQSPSDLALTLQFTIVVSAGGKTLNQTSTTLNCGNNNINLKLTGSKPTPGASPGSLSGIITVTSSGSTDPATAPNVITGYKQGDPILSLTPGKYQVLSLGSNGSYKFTNITPGTYTLSGSVSAQNIAAGDSIQISEQVTIGSGQNKVLNLDGKPGTGNLVSGSNTSGTAAANVDSCSANGGGFAWFVCGALDLITKIETYLFNFVTDMLATPPVNFSCAATGCPNDPTSTITYSVWSNFRLYGNLLLIAALLGAILAEAIGGGVIEAYTVKKMLPRILIAAILINISIYLVVGLEDITNVIGSGVGHLLLSPFQIASKQINNGNTGITIGGGTGFVVTGALAGLAVAAGFTEGIVGIALLAVGTLLLAAVGVLVTLMIRQGLLVVLVVVSPVAFALFCLPNTEQYFRKWWDLLFKTLLVFPIVEAVFAMSSIAAIVVSNMTTSGPTLLRQVMAILAAAAPLFLVPFAFKMSGGVIGSVQNAANGIRSRVNEPLRNLRKQNRADRTERARAGNLFRGNSRLAKRGSDLAQNAMFLPKAGFRPKNMKSSIAAAKSAAMSTAMDKALENEAVAAVVGNDDLLNAWEKGRGTDAGMKSYLMGTLGQSEQEADENVRAVNQARRAVGRDVFEKTAAVANVGTGTGYASGPSEMLETIARTAGNDQAIRARMLAKARGNAERARRVDLYGAGFATSMDVMRQLSEGKTSSKAANRKMTDEALKTKSIGEIASARHNAFSNMQDSIVGRVADAQYGVEAAESALASAQMGGNQVAMEQAQAAYDEAAHNKYKVLAQTSALTDVAGQVAAENSDVIGAINGQKLGAGDKTMGQEVKDLEQDAGSAGQQYSQYKRTYTASDPEAARLLAQRGMQGNGNSSTGGPNVNIQFGPPQ